MALIGSVAISGCAAWEQLAPVRAAVPLGPSPAELTRVELAAGNLQGAELLLGPALAPVPPESGNSTSSTTLEDTAELLVLRAELRIRQGRYVEAESDALTALALVPATPPAAQPVAPPSPDAEPEAGQQAAGAAAVAPTPPLLNQRSIHIRLAQLFEDAGRDDSTEQHLEDARALCLADAALVESGSCQLEREALVRIRIARGRYVEAEPLVLEEISDVQSRYGAWDIRLSVALCHVADFYARQGSYTLSGPLFARSLDLWNSVHEEARAEHERAIAAGQPSPYGADFLRPRAGHFPFTAPCGLQDQPDLAYKLGKASSARDAIRLEEELWESDSTAGTEAVAQLNALVARGADPLDIASVRHAVAFVALRKGDRERAERELRLVVEAYAAAWPSIPRSERRYRIEDYLAAQESLIELLRGSQRFGEAITLGERAAENAVGGLDAYDARRLDTLLSLTKTFREMRDANSTEAAAVRYLDAIVAARGDTSCDYAWALRTLSYAYLLRGQMDAFQRMEMQATAIWAKQSVVAPAF